MKILPRSLVVTISLLLLWQLLVTGFTLPPYILPSPQQVLVMWYHSLWLIMQQAIPTTIEMVLGLGLSSIFGVLTALLMMLLKPLRLWLLPLLLISQAMPTFAIAPLLVIWLGYGIASKIMTTLLMVYFPVTSAFYDGLTRIPIGWLNLAQTMNASTWQILWRIQVPAALPALASGLRVATAIAPIGAIIGEWVGASQGLGFLMLEANARMQIDLMFACLLTLVILALVLYFVVDYGLRRWVYWHASFT